MNRILLLLLFITAGVSGCYKDKGNYGYSDVNEVVVEMEKQYSTRLIDTTVVIRPGIIQSIAGDTTNLKFEWWLNSNSDQQKGRLVSTADTVGVKIDPGQENLSFKHNLRLYITDKMTGAGYMFPVLLEVINPYLGTWMVLHEGDDGLAKLGRISYTDEGPEVVEDATGKQFTGKPSKLGVATYYSAYRTVPTYSPTCLFFCFTSNPAESGAMMPERGFRIYGSPDTFIYPGHMNDFDITNIVTCEGAGRGRLMISGGNIFQGGLYNRSMYRVNRDEQTISGDVNITHGCCIGWTHVAFDSEGKRFIHFYNINESGSEDFFNEPKENVYKYSNIRFSVNSLEEPDPNNLSADQEMVYLGPGFWYGSNMSARQSRVAAYGITVSDGLDSLCLYELHGNQLYSGDNADNPDAPFPFFNKVKNTFGITVDTPMASSTAYNRVLFYGDGNKVYRLNLGSETGISDVIYTHTDVGARISIIKPARGQRNGEGDYDNIYKKYGHAVDQSFAVVFETTDGKGEVVVLNLNSAGRVIGMQKELSGFGKITDIVFI